MSSGLSLSDIDPQRQTLVTSLFSEVPTGVGATGALKLSAADERQVMVQGARWAVNHGYGFPEDLDHMEEQGCLAGADCATVSDGAWA